LNPGSVGRPVHISSDKVQPGPISAKIFAGF
jgi:hypothetical protein